MPQVHHLKTWPQFWHAVARGDKTFEVRKDDRAFQAGDTLILQLYDPNANEPDVYPLSVERRVSFVLSGGQFGVEPGFVVMGIMSPQEFRALDLANRPTEGGGEG